MFARLRSVRLQREIAGYTLGPARKVARQLAGYVENAIGLKLLLRHRAVPAFNLERYHINHHGAGGGLDDYWAARGWVRSLRLVRRRILNMHEKRRHLVELAVMQGQPVTVREMIRWGFAFTAVYETERVLVQFRGLGLYCDEKLSLCMLRLFRKRSNALHHCKAYIVNANIRPFAPDTVAVNREICRWLAACRGNEAKIESSSTE